jgi:hypothetical protein
MYTLKQKLALLAGLKVALNSGLISFGTYSALCTEITGEQVF